jgi:hypothetical protein
MRLSTRLTSHATTPTMRWTEIPGSPQTPTRRCGSPFGDGTLFCSPWEGLWLESDPGHPAPTTTRHPFDH